MKLRYIALSGAVAASLSFAVLAQTPTATDVNSARREQIRAVKKFDRIANKALAKKVQDTISKDKSLHDSDIAVFATAKTGKVILAGTIKEASDDQVAQEIAGKVPGVQTVISRLVVAGDHGS
ncbi:BON domain-containing protein [Paraburkholderia sp. MMS20-SJTN17]|uniref:BON domain-containing protein n=1 Tax=Paraburkholderia translucens TaxID=2886945 RepID=A0ABS8KIQ5_9BURK|nr:BON domain-containing protein [Paraburkholderia sp. MMS20-SJTN17]MCC8404647.1 BON domain-containing protein [Paraburkholderia sp. MMS20-SJTN17]